MSKDATATTTTRPDAQTAQWQDLWRKSIAGSLGGLTGNQALMDYAGNSFNGLGLPDPNLLKDQARQNFGMQRDQATMAANDLATKAGAYGGDRSAILQAQMLGDVNRNESQALGGIDYQNQQDQWQRVMQLLGLAGGASQVGGQTTSQQMPSNPFGTLIGLGATAGGLGWSPFK